MNSLHSLPPLVLHLALALSLTGTAIPAQASELSSSERILVLVQGAAGAPEFGKLFDDWSQQWIQLAGESGHQVHHIQGAGENEEDPAAKDRLQTRLANAAQLRPQELWLVLNGHGTYDGRTAKFNLQGMDFSATELHHWLEPLDNRVIVINTASSSAPFLQELSATNRIVITATKSAFEHNFTRFGGFLPGAFTATEADLDKDGAVSLLEAFLYASRQTQDYYTSRGQLATEHPLLDDNADGKGTPADFYRGLRPAQEATTADLPDGTRAHQVHFILNQADEHLTPEQRLQRDALELQIIQLRQRKSELPKDDYYQKLESLLLEMAEVLGIQPQSP